MASTEQIQENVALSEQEKTITLTQPNGELYLGADGKPSTFTHLGSESKAYIEARNKITRRALKHRRSTLTPEELVANRIDLAAATMRAWSGWESGDKPLPFSVQAVKLLLAAEHILLQLEESIGEHADFFTASSNGLRK